MPMSDTHSNKNYGSVMKDEQQPILPIENGKAKGEVSGRPSDEFTPMTKTVDEAIEMVGFGRFQYMLLISTGLCFMADSMEVTLLAFLSSILRQEWHLTKNQAASISATVFFGEVCGALVYGRLGDTFGRRPTFLIAAVTISTFGILTALCDDFWWMLTIRFVVGFGVGGMAIPFDVFAEFLPDKQRGEYLMMINYFWTAGSVLVTFFAYYTIGLEDGGSNWRIFVLLCSIPALCSGIMCYLYVPESPRWLVSEGRGDEAMEIIQQVADWNGCSSVFGDGEEGTKCVLKEDGPVEESNFRELLTPKWRKLTLCMWGVWFGYGFSYYGTIMAITRVFMEDDDSSTDDNDYQVSFNFPAIAISASAESLGVFISVFTVEGIGRIASQVLFYALGGISGVVLLLPWTGTQIWFLTGLSFVARASEIAANCMTWITTAEILNTEIRATGHSSANAVCRVGAFLASYAVQGDTSLTELAVMMVFIHVFTIFCVAQLPETKGKALGDIVHL